jgi:hypothetical protein
MGTQAFDAPPAPPATGPPPGRRRSRRRLVPLVALAIALAAAVVAAVLIAHLDGSSTRSGSTSSQGTPSGTHGTPVVVARATAFDPPPGDGVEDDGDLAHLFDGDPSTSWHTEFYGSREFGGLKAGVGFVLTLDQSRQLQDLVLTSPTPQYNVSVYVANSSPSQLSGWGQPTATVTNAPGRAVVPLHGRQGSHVLVWFTRLSPTNVVQIGEAQLTA